MLFAFVTPANAACVFRWAALTGVAAAVLFFNDNQWIQEDGEVNFKIKNQNQVRLQSGHLIVMEKHF
jgi:hypothetical protein